MKNTVKRERILDINIDTRTGCTTLYLGRGMVCLDPLSADAISKVYGNDVDDWVGKEVDLVTRPRVYSVDVRPVKSPEQIAAEKIAASRIKIIDNLKS